MEKATKKAAKGITKEQLQLQYMEYMLLQEKTPSSVFAFTKAIKVREADFYAHYNSFRALEGDIWKTWFEDTLAVLHDDTEYPQYSVREKMLSFYYTWLEMLKKNRSYVLMKFEKMTSSELTPAFLSPLKEAFKNYVNDLLMEGKDTSEIADRRFANQYDKGFWIQLMFVTRFWANDDSPGYEHTDAAVEKAVNFSFDLVARGPLDSFLDLAKFLYQTKRI